MKLAAGFSVWLLVGMVTTLIVCALGYGFTDWLYSLGLWPLGFILRIPFFVILVSLVFAIPIYLLVGLGMGIEAIWMRLRARP
jgi:hypothetical protein